MMEPDTRTLEDRITGCLLGIATGDSIGLPFRSLVFTVLVLLHGFRRIFPPY